MNGDSEVGAGGGGLLGTFNEIFNPASKHTAEQLHQDRTVGRITKSSGAGPIDFNSGSIHLNVNASEVAGAADPTDDDQDEVSPEASSS